MKLARPGLELWALVSPLAALMLTLSSTSPGWLLPAAGAANTPLAGTPSLRADVGALQLLEKAERAPATTAYHGVQFISAWTEYGASGLVVEVNHRPGVGTSVHTDGNAYTAPADTYVPADDKQPSLVSGSNALALLTTNYELIRAGGRTVAGRATDVVEARRPGARTPSGRFWIDVETGLVLRREVYDDRGRTTRASAFVEIEVGRAHIRGRARSRLPAAWPQEVADEDFARMRADGWHCPKRLAGSLSLVDARRGGGARAPILHLSFSDGLSSVSLFEQRGRLNVDKLEGYQATSRHGGTVYERAGVPMRVVWESEGMVFTIVADAPATTVDEVVSALPQPDQSGGGWGRLSRGMDRVASWFNPFG